jgi:hypothetical protein
MTTSKRYSARTRISDTPHILDTKNILVISAGSLAEFGHVYNSPALPDKLANG